MDVDHTWQDGGIHFLNYFENFQQVTVGDLLEKLRGEYGQVSKIWQSQLFVMSSSIVQGGGRGQLDSLSGRAVFGSSLGATQHSQGG